MTSMPKDYTHTILCGFSFILGLGHGLALASFERLWVTGKLLPGSLAMFSSVVAISFVAIWPLHRYMKRRRDKNAEIGCIDVMVHLAKRVYCAHVWSLALLLVLLLLVLRPISPRYLVWTGYTLNTVFLFWFLLWWSLLLLSSFDLFANIMRKYLGISHLLKIVLVISLLVAVDQINRLSDENDIVRQAISVFLAWSFYWMVVLFPGIKKWALSGGWNKRDNPE